MSNWKPGNLVTIEGIVYRVKRGKPGNVCRQCAFKMGVICRWPSRKRYSLPPNCYLKRVSP